MTGLHPRWCHPLFCTAAAPRGEHRSEPRRMRAADLLFWRLGAATLWWAYLFLPEGLVGAATPFIRIYPDGDDGDPRAFEIPRGPLGEFVDDVRALVEQAVDAEPEAPRGTDDEAGPQVPPLAEHVEGHLFGYGGCRRACNVPAPARYGPERVNVRA